MSAENEIREIVSRYTRAADWRDGEALAKLYEADAVVEIHYRGSDGMELLGTLSGGAQIAAAMSTAMAPHPPLGWSHHTTYDHLVSVDGDEASIDTQFITFDVVGTRKQEGGWPVGTFGAQGTIKPSSPGTTASPSVGPTGHGASATWTSYTTSPTSSDHPAARPRRPHGGLRRGAAEADLSRSGAVRRSPAGRHPAAMRLGLLRHPPLPVDPGDDSQRRYGP